MLKGEKKGKKLLHAISGLLFFSFLYFVAVPSFLILFLFLTGFLALYYLFLAFSKKIP